MRRAVASGALGSEDGGGEAVDPPGREAGVVDVRHTLSEANGEVRFRHTGEGGRSVQRETRTARGGWSRQRGCPANAGALEHDTWKSRLA